LTSGVDMLAFAVVFIIRENFADMQVIRTFLTEKLIAS